MTEENMQYLRTATIHACGDEKTKALEQLAAIPGYTLVEAGYKEGTVRTHDLKTPSGDTIVLVNDPNSPGMVVAAQVLVQDQNPGHVPFQDDELVKFAKIANETQKVNVTVTASTHDLQSLGKE
ncbi:hypothetical protein WBQ28_10950 [Pseudomonas syringae pv. syringae]|uniref:hypothetical protein n=1 Tax=Pseudomonas syringae TaxID=317 RepID=UPI003B0018AF